MSRVRIYVAPEEICDSIRIDEKGTIHKLKDVLRLKEDKEIYVFDGKGKEYLYKITEVKRSSVLIEKGKIEREEDCPIKKIGLGFPLLRSEKVDFILQKATELGVWEIYPFVCQRSISKKPLASKSRRWQRIVIEAARQCNRLWVPRVREVLDFKKIITQQWEIKLAASSEGGSLTKRLNKKAGNILLIVGPEGDFSPQEYYELKRNDFRFVGLSPHILRVETAAIFGAGLINYFLRTNEHR